MKKIVEATVLENYGKDSIYFMRIYVGELAEHCGPGQFVNIYTKLESAVLPRPISICEIDTEAKTLRLVYQVVGRGTDYFSGLKKGEALRVMGPLGTGFQLQSAKSYALVGGGIGTPPLLQLAKELRKREPESRITAFLGFRSMVFLMKDFMEAGCSVHVATDNGNTGFKGNVIELMERIPFDYDLIYSCGPKVMLQSLAKFANQRNVPCQVSMEERMACGIGACVGCAVKIGSADNWEYKKVCKDGPVFDAKEVLWDE